MIYSRKIKSVLCLPLKGLIGMIQLPFIIVAICCFEITNNESRLERVCDWFIDIADNLIEKMS
jgi:hypothetical protein